MLLVDELDKCQCCDPVIDGWIGEAIERIDALEAALKPFAVYADYMAPRWTQIDGSSRYGTKRGPQVTYGDWRKAARVLREKP